MTRVFLRSSRFIHWIPIILNSVLATIISGGNISEGLFIGIQISCIASFSFVFNDILDANIDKVNWEARMSELGFKSRFILGIISIIYLFFTFGISWLFKPETLEAMFFLTIILLGYNILFKRVLFIGNIIAAVTIMSPIWIPYFLYDSPVNPFILTIVSSGVVYSFSREIIFDLADTKGDSKNKRHTYPTIIGLRGSIILSLILHAIAFLIIILSPLFIHFDFSIVFQFLLSLLFILIMGLSFSKLKFLIKFNSDEINLDSLKPFIAFSRLNMISFSIILLIYYFVKW